MENKDRVVSPVRQQAREAANTARAAIFRMRARELGGVNAKTRPIIESEAQQGAAAAAKAVYEAAGYTPCTGTVPVWYPEENVHMPEECDRLCSPGYTLCFAHSADLRPSTPAVERALAQIGN